MAADNDFYLETCRDLLERMINTVPRDVQLTEVIKPLHTKPDFIDVKLNDDGSFFISGEIRVSSDIPIFRPIFPLVSYFRTSLQRVYIY